MRKWWASPLALLVMGMAAPAAEKPLPQPWDYVAAMKKVAADFHGRPGVVLHVGDSITYANPYSQWALNGDGKSEDDKAALQWMHAGAGDDSDGWHLARFDHPDGGRSYTACSGIRIDEMLAGGKNKMPSLDQILTQYKPQAVVLMLGTNDASAGRPIADYAADMTKAVDLILGRGVVCILSTIPPHPGKPELAKSYNDELRKLAKARAAAHRLRARSPDAPPRRLERHAARQERRPPHGRPRRRHGPLRPDGREPAQQRLPAARLAVGGEN